MRFKALWYMISCFMLVLLAGCTPAGPVSSPTPEPTVDADIRATVALPPGAERVPPTSASQPVVGEVPQSLMTAVMDDLVAQTGVDSNTIEVVRAESVLWSDGSLGCPQPGVFYTQALVAGYHIILAAGGRTYDYRAAESGDFRLCQNAPPQLSTPAR